VITEVILFGWLQKKRKRIGKSNEKDETATVVAEKTMAAEMTTERTTAAENTMATTVTDLVTARTGIGVGVGALFGLALAGGPIGLGIGALVGGAIAHTTSKPFGSITTKRKGEMTPKRHLVFVRAMESIKAPDDLRELADAFHGEGLVQQAELLRRRADSRELPEEEQEKRRAVFRKAMASDKPDAIDACALAFARAGSIGAARALKEHAAAVRAAHAAGRSTKPVDPRVLEAFADKVAHAVTHFGPESTQAASAARNLLRAMNRPSGDDAVRAMVARAVTALTPEGAVADGDESAASDGNEAAASEASNGKAAPRNAAVAIEEPGVSAIEPTVVGPPAAPVEAPVVASAPAGTIAPSVVASAAASVVPSAAASVAEETEEVADAREPMRMRVSP
jgi:hypothetical protein